MKITINKYDVELNKIYKFYDMRIEQLECDFIKTKTDELKLKLALIDTINFYITLQIEKENNYNEN